jgi:hypothetical protein
MLQLSEATYVFSNEHVLSMIEIIGKYMAKNEPLEKPLKSLAVHARQ